MFITTVQTRILFITSEKIRITKGGEKGGETCSDVNQR